MTQMTQERAILAAAAVLFLWFLGAHDLWAPDEPFFAEGAREMLADGHWLVSHVNGEVNSHKPPLFFWLIAWGSMLFGAVSELTARLPSVLAALGTLWITLRLGRQWYGPRTAVLAAVILATAHMFWDKARWVQIDALLCFLIWAALLAFAKFRANEAGGRGAGMVFWSAMALAVLAKGPVGLLLPLAIALITLAWDRNLGRWRQFAPLLGPLCFVAIAGGWVVAVNLWGPQDYSVFGALREHFVERGMHGMHHARPFWYYLHQLPVSLLPWTGLLPGALYLAWRHQRQQPAVRLALVATVFILVFFSISTEKRDLYVLPAFPAIALMMAGLVAVICGWERSHNATPALHRRWVTIGQGVVGGLFVLTGVALAVMAASGRDLHEVPVWMALVLSGIITSMGAAVLVFALRSRPLRSVQTTAAGMVALYLFATACIYPALDPVKSARDFALIIKDTSAESRAAGHQVVAWRTGNLPNSFAFYTNGLYTVDTNDPEVLAAHLRQSATVFAVVQASTLGDVPADALAHAWVVDRTRLSRRDLLLISNTTHPQGVPLEQLE